MKPDIRVHIKLEPARSLQRLWTFDDPEKVTIGIDPRASIWLDDPECQGTQIIFERIGGDICLRAAENLTGFLFIEENEIPLAALRETGLLKSDRQGDYVALKKKTVGYFNIGKTKVSFWITLAPSQPEFPMHPVLVRLLFSIPKRFTPVLLLSLVLHALFLWGYLKVPIPHELPIEDADRRVTRLLIPEERYEEVSIDKKRPPVERGKRRKGLSPPKTVLEGLVAAVKGPRSSGKASPFSALFSTSSIGGDLEKVLGQKSLDDVIAQQVQMGGGGEGYTSSPDTVEIGDLRQTDLEAPELAKEVKGPAFARLSLDAPDIDGRLDRQELTKVLNLNVGQLRDCYERGLTRKPSLAGKVVVGLVINSRGKAEKISIQESTLRDRSVERCITSKIASWKFPKPEGGSTPVRFPFIFSAASRG